MIYLFRDLKVLNNSVPLKIYNILMQVMIKIYPADYFIPLSL